MASLFEDDPPVDFEIFWLSGPWLKLGKEAARRHFNKTVKTRKAWLDIQVARDKYKAHLEHEHARDFDLRPQHGSTWFHNWQDWIEFEEPKIGGKSGNHKESKDAMVARRARETADRIRARINNTTTDCPGSELVGGTDFDLPATTRRSQ